MAAVPIGHRLEHGGAALLTRAVQQPGARLDNGVEVVAVDALAVHAMRSGAPPQLGLGEARPTEVPMPYSLLRIRNTIGRCQSAARLSDSCHAPMFTAPSPSSQSTASRAALADERQRQAGGHRQLAGHDAPAAVEAAAHVEQVH